MRLRCSNAACFLVALQLAVAAPLAARAEQDVVLTHLRNNVYVVEDYAYAKENSVVYVGDEGVTVIGATWTPETARQLATEIGKVTRKPIQEVIDTNYHPDRAGGNAYFRSIGARIVSTQMTRDLLSHRWDSIVRSIQRTIPGYPAVPLVLPDTTYAGDFELQGGRVRAIYLGPSHSPHSRFASSMWLQSICGRPL